MSGKAISLACESYVYSLEAIEEYIGEKIPVVWPEEDWFLSDKSYRARGAGKQRSAAKRKGPPAKKKRARQRSAKKSTAGSRSQGRKSGDKRRSAGTGAKPNAS
jgi:ATP-dependent RNA helicase RhlB